MNDWFRSIATLSVAFIGVVVVTLCLALVVAPAPPVSSQATDPGQSGAPAGLATPAAATGIPGLGGTLTVSGDREGTLRATRQAEGPGYGLSGDGGRIFFDGEPLSVIQMNFDGLSFYPEPEQCTITPGNLSNAIGIGMADLRCEGLTDIRGNGVITVAGEIGLPMDLLVARELPPSGGTVDVGGETWEFGEAILITWPAPIIGGRTYYHMELVSVTSGFELDRLNFTYDHETHGLTLANIERNEESIDLADDACDLRAQELGRLSPRTAVIELSIGCAEVDVPGLGLVPITGTVIVDRHEFPE